MKNQNDFKKEILSNKIKELIQYLATSPSNLSDKEQTLDDLQKYIYYPDSDKRQQLINAIYIALAFPYIPEKEVAWKEMIQLINHNDKDMRWSAAYALGLVFLYVPNKEQAWEDLKMLLRSEDVYVRGGAVSALGISFPYIPDKKEAWDYLMNLVKDTEKDVSGMASIALGLAFLYAPDKTQAWQFLIRLTHDTHGKLKKSTANALNSVFFYSLDKKQLWIDLIEFKDADKEMNLAAISSLGSVFPYCPDKKKAWDYLIGLTRSSDKEVKKGAINALGFAFQYIPNQDKEKIWDYLMILINDKNSGVVNNAVNALGLAFPYTPYNMKAWKDLGELMLKPELSLRAADVLGSAYHDLNDKRKGWEDIHFLAKHKNSLVRMSATKLIGLIFSDIPNKESAYDDLWLLSLDDNIEVRRNAIFALGSVYFVFPEKKGELEFRLTRLTEKFEPAEIREYAYFTLGKLSLYKATLPEYKDNFEEQIQSALNYFEKSAGISNFDDNLNPAKFCLPFYHAFFLITFRKQVGRENAERYLNEAKMFAKGSENKEKLIEAIEDLEKTLNKIHNEIDLNKIHNEIDLNYMRKLLIKYMHDCELTSDILDSMKESEPITEKIIRTGLLKIDEKIIEEIQVNIKILCKNTQSPEIQDLGKKIYQISKDILQIRNSEALEKNINNLQDLLYEICDKMSGKEKDEACKLLNKLNEEQNIEFKIGLINIFLSKISPMVIPRETDDKPKTLLDRLRHIIKKLVDPATIASFVGFIILELSDIFPVEYNKHVLSLIGAAIFFSIVFIVTRKK